jgi:DNA polymerase III delta subunit
MFELLVGNDDFSKYKYCSKLAKNEKKIFRTFNLKSWKNFEDFVPELYRKTLFSSEYCIYCDFIGTLSKKRIDFLKEISQSIEESEDNYLFIGVEKSIKGLKKNKKTFSLPKPWKDEEWKMLISQMAFEKELKLTQKQVDRLLYETDNDLWKINNELEKFRLISDDKKIDEKTFDNLFYSYSKESLQKFVAEFVNKKTTKSLKKIEEIFLEYNPMQILYKLSNVYVLIYKIRMICLSSNINSFNFNSVKEISATVNSNIPSVSDIVGFSFDRNEKKDKICFQYSEKELEEIIYELLMIEIDFKSGKIDFKGKILELFNKVHFEKKTV